MNGHVPKVEGVPITGLAVSLDEAAADFKRSYEAMREKASLPKPQVAQLKIQNETLNGNAEPDGGLMKRQSPSCI
jgi:hypothetical protein